MFVSVYSLGCVVVVAGDGCGIVDVLVAVSVLAPAAAVPVPNCQQYINYSKRHQYTNWWWLLN